MLTQRSRRSRTQAMSSGRKSGPLSPADDHPVDVDEVQGRQGPKERLE